ncbi:hypothetical protein [Hymenobacter sp. GOD-10R]|uniref:hypothetical protein n=1 Tax=Hymenobacter sp. GOD-10R TaxID=3093922 RepID=UPI002D77CC3E|nr:hypothetical protein [Hymenobacter sp. GOD-10R]WRQ31787.1 hypothetical protein SD425_28475 [Hymenobacter sp. GOD-10R]
MPADLVAILDALRLQLLSLTVAAPYYWPRLLRVAQQLEYVVHVCPPEEWPVKRKLGGLSLGRQVQGVVPTQQQFQWHVAALQASVRDKEPPSDCYAWHQQLLDLILCVL